MSINNKVKIFAAASVLAIGAGYADAALAQDASAQASLAVAAQLISDVDQVVVTGTRTAGRTVQSSAAPIDVLSNREVALSNKPTLLETLNTLLPSFNLPNVNNPNVASMIRAGQLRGLNPDQTLVLVNGKRRHSTAFLGAGGFGASAPVDLSMIPNAGIDRIEVLRDGASAIYGSDAIAGVINIITKTRDTGGEISYRYGQFFEGDGTTNVVQGDIGLKIGKGYLNLAGEITEQDATVRNFRVPDNFLYYFPLNAAGQEIAPTGLGSTNGLPTGARPNPKEANRDPYTWKNTGSAAFKQQTLDATFGAPITADIDFYGFGTFGHRTSSAVQNFRTPSRNEVVRAIYPDGFSPIEAIREHDYALTGGFKGTNLFGFSWDLSSSYGRNIVDIDVHNSINPTYGTASPTDFYIGRNDYSSITTNFDLRRSFAAGTLPFPVDVSLGAEHRHENFKLEAGDIYSYTDGGVAVLDGPNRGTRLVGLGGSQALPGFRPSDAVDASRNAVSAYLGASAQVTKAWLVDVAGRYEHYSDFGDTFTGRVSTRYDFGKLLGVRGTVSNGFHAPALAAQYYKNTANQNTFIVNTLQVSSAQAKLLGAEPLKPEKSVNYSVGLVSQPVSWLRLAVDAYQISIKDRISQSTTFREALYPGAGALVQQAGFGPTDAITFFANAIDTRTRGVDITAETSTFDLGAFGRLRGSAALSWNLTKITDFAPTPAALAAYKVPLFAAANQTAITYLGPRNKQILSLNWQIGRFSTNVRGTHYGDIKRIQNPQIVATSGPWAGQTQIATGIQATWTTDIDVTFQATEHVRITASGNNIFDARPTKTPTPLLAANQSASYQNFGPVGAQGGFWSVKLAYSY